MSASRLGLIGQPLGHSISPFIHEQIMLASGIAGRYELFEIKPEEMDQYMPILMRDLHGFNCTIPYKEKIMTYLDKVDASADRLKAVNTVFQGCGYNTDLDGFRASNIDLKDKNVMLLGAGGVARVMAFEAISQAKKLTVRARRKEQAQALIDEIRAAVSSEQAQYAECVAMDDASDLSSQTYDVLLNATPVGMWPNGAELPMLSPELHADMTVFDTIYNPPATRWVLRAKKAGAKGIGGLSMLFHQALAAQKIWHPDADFNEERLKPILDMLPKRLLKQSPIKIVLTGFMGAGKSTIGRLLSTKLGVMFWDLDEEVERVRGMRISDIFRMDGEENFRQLETMISKELLKKKDAGVIAVGGGWITRPENRSILENGSVFTIYLDASMDTIWMRISSETHRPLIADSSISDAERFSQAARLYSARLPEYQSYCDLKIAAETAPEEVVKNIIAALGYGG